VQDPITGQWVDPFALYDAQGLRLWGVENPASYNLILDGQVAYTFTSQDSGFTIDAMGNNQIIGGYLDNLGAQGAYPLPSGAFVGANLGSTTCTWLGGESTIAAVRASDTIGSPILWGGAFAGVASGYIGLEFYTDGQPYYGWVRVGAPVSINGGWIYDYAYETSPDTPIKAGQTNEPIYFEATFSGDNEVPPDRSTHSGNGSFILESYVDGYRLSYNVELDGAFQPTSAGIFGPAKPCLNSSHLIADLGTYTISNLPPPLLPIGPVPLDLQRPEPISPVYPSVLVYSGQITLAGNQVAELLQGQLYVNFKSAKYREGELRGEIFPTAPIQFSATLSGRNEIPRNVSAHRGEAAFTLAGNNLTYELALDNFTFTSAGIYAAPIAFPSPFDLIAKLDITLGVVIPVGGLPGVLGLPGQTLYEGQSALSLTDEEVYRLKHGEFYIEVLTPHFRNGEIGGRILPNE